MNINYFAPGGFDHTPREDVGVLILQPTQAAVLHLTFPDGRPGKDFKYYRKAWSGPDRVGRVDLGPQKVDRVNNGHTLRWEIPQPMLNHAYVVEWAW